MPLLAPSGWHWPPRVVAKTSGRQKTDSEWDSQVIYWMTVAFTFWLLVHSVLQALAIEWTWRAQPLKRDEMSWWSTHTHLTSGCRLKRSVARRKTMGWPPNAIQPSETCRLVSAGWWDDKFLKWPCTFRRIGVQNHCFTSRWWAQLKQRAPKKLWTFQVHDRLPPVFLTFCFNLLSPWYSQHSSCFTTLHLPVIRPDHPWPASNRVTSTCSTEASSLGTLSRSFNLSRWEDSTWIRCHILILRPRFFFKQRITSLHLTVNLLNLTYVNTIVNMFLDKIWRFSQVHGATRLARLLSGRQQLAGHASLCGLNVKSSVRCCSQPYQLSSSFRSLCFHGNLKCWAKFVVACSVQC